MTSRIIIGRGDLDAESVSTAPESAHVDAEIADLAHAAAQAAGDKLGLDTVIIDVGAVMAIVDYFVITNGNNDRQVKAIVDEIERTLFQRHGVKPRRVEGLDSLTWVLMDYGFLIVHVFDEETRAYYDLERLWKDMPRLEWS